MKKLINEKKEKCIINMAYNATKKWRLSNPDKRSQMRKTYYKRHPGSAFKKGSAWSDEECNRVLSHNIPDVQLSKEIGRSVQAIQLKRHKLTHPDE